MSTTFLHDVFVLRFSNVNSKKEKGQLNDVINCFEDVPFKTLVKKTYSDINQSTAFLKLCFPLFLDIKHGKHGAAKRNINYSNNSSSNNAKPKFKYVNNVDNTNLKSSSAFKPIQELIVKSMVYEETTAEYKKT
jgi:hypothetical protein